MFNRNANPSHENNLFNYGLEGEAERFASIVIASAANNRPPSPTRSPCPALLATAEIPINAQRLNHLLNGTETHDQEDIAMGELSEDDYFPKDSISLDPKVNSNMQPIGKKKARIDGAPAAFALPPTMQPDAASHTEALNPNRIPGLFGYSADEHTASGMSLGLTVTSRSSSMMTPSFRNVTGTASHGTHTYTSVPADHRGSTSGDLRGQSHSSTSDHRITSASSPRDSSTTHTHSSSWYKTSTPSAVKRSATHYPPRPPSPRSAATKTQIAKAAAETRAALQNAEESFHILTSLSGMRRSEDEREIDYLRKQVEYRKNEFERLRGLLHKRDGDMVSMRGRADKAEARVRELESRANDLGRQAGDLRTVPAVKNENMQD